MTNHIENMMKTAGVTSDFIPRYINGGVATYWYLSEYPEFTAEKQLELIKLIAKTYAFYSLFDNTKSQEWRIGSVLSFDYKVKNKDFEQALAQLTTGLIKAGELDKSKVKEILER